MGVKSLLLLTQIINCLFAINVGRTIMLCYFVLLIIINQWLADGYKSHPKGCLTQDDLVEQLRYDNVIRSDVVAEAMSKIDRKFYLPYNPYEDVVKLIPALDVIDNPPHMLAFALELLKDNLKLGNKVLDVGFGSGYLTAVMGQMVGHTGLAVGIDTHVFKAGNAKESVWKDRYLGRIIRNTTEWIKFETGELKQGVPKYGPYDAIHVMPAVKEVPQTFLDQLNRGGRLLIPIGNFGPINEYRIYDKDVHNGTVYCRKKSVKFFARRSLEPPTNRSELFM